MAVTKNEIEKLICELNLSTPENENYNSLLIVLYGSINQTHNRKRIQYQLGLDKKEVDTIMNNLFNNEIYTHENPQWNLDNWENQNEMCVILVLCAMCGIEQIIRRSAIKII